MKNMKKSTLVLNMERRVQNVGLLVVSDDSFNDKSNISGVRVIRVTEQQYVSIFFTRLWSVRKRKPLLFDTQNPGISGFSTAHACKYKTKQQANMKIDIRKRHFC